MFLVFLFCLNQTHMYNGLWNNRRQRPLAPLILATLFSPSLSIPPGHRFLSPNIRLFKSKIKPCILFEWCNCCCNNVSINANRILSSAKNFTVPWGSVFIAVNVVSFRLAVCSYVFCNVEAISRRLRAFIWQVMVLMDWTKTIFFPLLQQLLRSMKIAKRSFETIFRHMRWTYQELLSLFEENQHWITFHLISLKRPLLEYMQLPNFPRCLFSIICL